MQSFNEHSGTNLNPAGDVINEFPIEITFCLILGFSMYTTNVYPIYPLLYTFFCDKISYMWEIT
jgi:hypothetical protein